MDDLGSRVRDLVLNHFGGEKNAARVTGVARTTLRRVMAGEIADPRLSVLAKLAKATGADTGWFVSGEGKGPDQIDPTAIRLPGIERWRAFVASLDLPPKSRDAMLTLPRSTAYAFAFLTVELATVDAPPLVEMFARAQEQEVRTWETFFKGLIEHYGRDAVRAKLAEKPGVLASRFNPALYRLWRETGKLEAGEREAWRKRTSALEPTTAADIERLWDLLPLLGQESHDAEG